MSITQATLFQHYIVARSDVYNIKRKLCRSRGEYRDGLYAQLETAIDALNRYKLKIERMGATGR